MTITAMLAVMICVCGLVAGFECLAWAYDRPAPAGELRPLTR